MKVEIVNKIQVIMYARNTNKPERFLNVKKIMNRAHECKNAIIMLHQRIYLGGKPRHVLINVVIAVWRHLA